MNQVSRQADGIICFGGVDWWYHNRGHYDLQMMRELSRRVPVLYVNSIGMRFPQLGEGSVFLRRIQRKLESFRKGLVEVRPKFYVYTPITFPSQFAKRIINHSLARQVRREATKIGIRYPLLWIACPPACEILDKFDSIGVVYQRTDRYEVYPSVNQDLISGYDKTLKERADITVYCSSLLINEEGASCRHAVFVDHGVDYDRFAISTDGFGDPEDIKHLPHPRIGYIGNLETHRVDYRMLCRVAERLPNLSFLVVGPSSLPANWCDLPNVTILPQKPYEQVPSYMAACDVLILPFNENEWIRACNPVKLKEYLAVGRPVVSTPFEELRNYKGFVNIASGEKEFANTIMTCLKKPEEAAFFRKRVEKETWKEKAETAARALLEIGISFTYTSDVQEVAVG